MTYTVPGTADTVVVPEGAGSDHRNHCPYGEDELVAYLDYTTSPMTIATPTAASLSMFDTHQADEVRVTVDKKCDMFAVKPAITDYDGIYMEDSPCAVQRDSHRNGAVEGEKRHNDAGRIRQHDGRRRAGRQRRDSQRGLKTLLTRYND
ncbi:MAG: hypothetical protein V8R10_00730 [Christensenellales bacterium]